jgi:hypothetical protein
MSVLDLFGRKVKGKNSVFVIRIEDPVPYPEQDTRWGEYGSHLCAVANRYFENLVVEYFRDENGMMDQINLVCYKSKLRYKACEEGEITAGLFRAISQGVEAFFKYRNTKAMVQDVVIPPAPSLAGYLASSISAKSDVEVESDTIQAPSQSERPNAGKASTTTSKPAVIVSPETGKPDLVVPLNKAFDMSDIDTEGATISRSDDGRYLMGYTSKSDGNRYYIEVPEEIVAKLMSQRG